MKTVAFFKVLPLKPAETSVKASFARRVGSAKLKRFEQKEPENFCKYVFRLAQNRVGVQNGATNHKSQGRLFTA